MVSKKILGAIGLLVLFSTLIFAGTASASGRSLHASPSSGPAGTVFTFHGSGFTPNKTLNVYAVEPDGLASAGCYNYNAPCDVKSSADGTVSFSWHSDRNSIRSQALGQYTWVVRELVIGGGAMDAQATVAVTSGGEDVVGGASLTVSNDSGRSFGFSGSGFLLGEIVNAWVTMPNNCSSDFTRYPSAAVALGIPSELAGTVGSSSIKADQAGQISFGVYMTSWDLKYHPTPNLPPGWFVIDAASCTGTYSMTVRSLKTGKSAAVQFEVVGNKVDADAYLEVTPVFGVGGGAQQRFPIISVSGWGFGPNEGVNCWSTRPDGGAYVELTFQTDGSGAFSGTWAVGWAWLGPSSEEPGLWYLTCRSPGSGRTGIASFWVGPKPNEPVGKDTSGAVPGGDKASPNPQPTPPPYAPVNIPSP